MFLRLRARFLVLETAGIAPVFVPPPSFRVTPRLLPASRHLHDFFLRGVGAAEFARDTALVHQQTWQTKNALANGNAPVRNL